ncbi:hypothetical protein FGB62_5g43 [Gracilaria domingensis]|nr:hypothetical protein FGB62_5g43 [Gracilaria domingensis]
MGAEGASAVGIWGEANVLRTGRVTDGCGDNLESVIGARAVAVSAVMDLMLSERVQLDASWVMNDKFGLRTQGGREAVNHKVQSL